MIRPATAATAADTRRLIRALRMAVLVPVEEVDVEAVRSMFDTNVLGIIRMVRAVAPIMRRQVSGRIVNVGSLAGKFGTTRARLCPGRPEQKLSVCHPGGCQSPAGYYPTGYGKTTRAARFSHPMVRVSL